MRRFTRPRLSPDSDDDNYRPRLRASAPLDDDDDDDGADNGHARLRAPVSATADLAARLRETLDQWEWEQQNGRRNREGLTKKTKKAPDKVPDKVPVGKASGIPPVSSRPVALDPATPRLLVTKRQAAEALGCRHRLVDKLIRTGELRARRLGNRIMVTVSSLESFMGESVRLGQQPVRRDAKAAPETAQEAGD